MWDFIIKLIVFAMTVHGMALLVWRFWPHNGKWGFNRSAVYCPECGERMPVHRFPANLRQAMGGGATCRRCRTEYDRYGERVEDK